MNAPILLLCQRVGILTDSGNPILMEESHNNSSIIHMNHTFPICTPIKATYLVNDCHSFFPLTIFQSPQVESDGSFIDWWATGEISMGIRPKNPVSHPDMAVFQHGTQIAGCLISWKVPIYGKSSLLVGFSMKSSLQLLEYPHGHGNPQITRNHYEPSLIIINHH